MTASSANLPQPGRGTFLTDGGMETTLIFHDGFDLPHFASFVLLDSPAGAEALRRYYASYADIARDTGHGFVFESPTWRASSDWGARLGYSASDLERINRVAVELLVAMRDEYRASIPNIVLSGCVGPRGDGYVPGEVMTPAEAMRYHAAQVRTFADTEADMLSAVTMTTADEATGIARAACEAGMAVSLSFTLETDGRLPDGQPLGEAIEQVDAQTDAYPAYYMINCAHPTHFAAKLTDTGSVGAASMGTRQRDASEVPVANAARGRAEGSWRARIGGIRANASTLSHAELDAAESLDSGDPADLAARYVELKRALPRLAVLGGCCGTDQRHIDHIARACV